MASYGVTETGFNIKPLTQIKSELEDVFRDVFGPQINLAPQSAQGQLIGLLADSLSETWEVLQDVYTAMDIYQSSGQRLDDLAAIVVQLTRNEGESDADFMVRVRTASTPNNKALPSALGSILGELDGVTKAYVLTNDTGAIDDNGLPPHSYAVVVDGGTAQQIAKTIWDYHPGGITLYGNTEECITDSSGIQRCIRYTVPVEVQLYIEVTLAPSACLCEISAADLLSKLSNYDFALSCKVQGNLTAFSIARAISSYYQDAEVLGVRFSVDGGTTWEETTAISWDNKVSVVDVTVVSA